MPSEGGVFSFSFDEPEHVGTLVDWIFAKDPCGSDLKTADWIEMCHMNTFGTDWYCIETFFKEVPSRHLHQAMCPPRVAEDASLFCPAIINGLEWMVLVL